MTTWVSFLRNSPLFATIPEESLAELAACARQVQAVPGELIFRDGDPGNSMYLIEQGNVAIVKHLDQQEVVLSLLQPGTIFGEMALIEDAPRSASARAVTNTMLMVLDKPDVMRVMQNHPHLLYEIMSLLSKRLRVSDSTYIADLERKNAELRRAYRLLQSSYEATLVALSRALDLRDQSTEGHSQRVTEISLLIADALGIDDAAREALRLGALLHDVGKIGVPDAILRKPGPLSPSEWEIMRQHPTWGKEIIAGVDFLQSAAQVVYAHHERIQGQGYPRGLVADEIPLGARIFAVADTFDAIASERPYKSSVPPQVALEEIKRKGNTLFDPVVVAAFERAFPRILETMQSFKIAAVRSPDS